MSAILPTPPLSAESPRRTPAWTGWLREPLLHFLLIGALLFAADHFVAGGSADPRVIVVDEAVDQEAIKVFRDARGRDPDDDELYALRRVWLDNEVLYREGLALQLDRGDRAIRDRVIFKALSLINADLKQPAYDDSALRAWFEKNRARYDAPSRFDFLEAVLEGEASEDSARRFAAALNAGAPGDARAGLRVFKGRPHANIVQSYGEGFALALEQSPQGEWRALEDGRGWRVVRLEAIAAARPAVFEDLQQTVRQDWTDAVMAEQRTEAVRALARKYTVKAEQAVK
jgi:hypothetical protein